MTRLRREHILLAMPGLALLVAFVLLFHDTEYGEITPSRSTFTDWVAATPAQNDDARPETASGAVAEHAHDDAVARAASDADAEMPRLHAREFRLQILGDDGQPVRGATIEVIARPTFTIDGVGVPDNLLGEHERFPLSSDEDGTAGFLGDLDSAYEIVVKADGYREKRYRLRDPGKRAIRLYRAASIWGYVHHADGHVLEGIEVELEHGLREVIRTTTKADGVYEFPSVTPTAATLRILSPSYGWKVRHLSDIESGGRYSVDFELEPGARLDVKVQDDRGRVVAGVPVKLFELNSNLLLGEVASGPAGTARFDALRDDRSYLVEVDGGNRGVRRLPVSAETFTDAGGLSYRRETVVLQTPWTLNGTVTTEEGATIGGARVVLESAPISHLGSSRHRVHTWSDENGGFVGNGLMPGVAYSVFAYHRDYAMNTLHGIMGQSGETVEAMISLKGKALVTGVLRDDFGLPVANAVVMLTLDAPMNSFGRRIIVRTNSQGEYVFPNLPSGPIKLEAFSLLQGRTAAPTELEIGLESTTNSAVKVSQN